MLSWLCVFPGAETTEFFTGSIQTRIASSTGQYGKIKTQLPDQYENQLFQYCHTRKNHTGSITFRIENICIMTQVGIYGEILPEVSGNPSGFALWILWVTSHLSHVKCHKSHIAIFIYTFLLFTFKKIHIII